MEVFNSNLCCFITIILLRDAMQVVMRCLSVFLPVCLSRSYMHSVKMNKHIFNFFHLRAMHTILILPYQTLYQYSDGTPPPNGVVECTWGREKSGLTQYLASCCES